MSLVAPSLRSSELLPDTGFGAFPAGFTSFFSILQGLVRTPKACATVSADCRNCSLTDPAQKVSSLILNLCLRTERARRVLKQHIELLYLLKFAKKKGSGEKKKSREGEYVYARTLSDCI